MDRALLEPGAVCGWLFEPRAALSGQVGDMEAVEFGNRIGIALGGVDITEHPERDRYVEDERQGNRSDDEWPATFQDNRNHTNQRVLNPCIYS